MSFLIKINRIGGVMVSVLASNAVDRGPGRSNLYNTITLVFVASPLSTQHAGERTNPEWPGIRIMCLSGATCLSAGCCCSVVAQ